MIMPPCIDDNGVIETLLTFVILFCDISEGVGSINSVHYIEEEWLVGVKVDDQRVRIILDENDLILYVNTGDGSNFALDAEGNLIYNKYV